MSEMCGLVGMLMGVVGCQVGIGFRRDAVRSACLVDRVRHDR